MRLTPLQVTAIRRSVCELAGANTQVWLFGSRTDDAGRGGDVDLLLEFDHAVDQPALLAAQIATRISRGLLGRKVDVLLKAPNLLQLPIHDLALAQGVRL